MSFRESFSNFTTVWVNKIGLLIPEQVAVRLASQAFEGRHYYCSMRLHKEGFYALVQRRVEDITNKFELIHQDLLSNLLELRKRPSIFHLITSTMPVIIHSNLSKDNP